MLNKTFDYLENDIFVAESNKYTFEFIQIIHLGSEEFEYLVIGDTVAYEDWMKDDLVGDLSEIESSYPFMACYHTFKQLELGNEDWNILCEDFEAVKKYLNETFNIDYDELVEC